MPEALASGGSLYGESLKGSLSVESSRKPFDSLPVLVRFVIALVAAAGKENYDEKKGPQHFRVATVCSLAVQSG
jgi:hypothetical protein